MHEAPDNGRSGRAVAIDAHAHILPHSVGDPALGYTWKGNTIDRGPDGRLRTSSAARPGQFSLMHEGSPEGLRARLDDMDAQGVDLQILSLSPSFWMYGTDGHDIVEGSRRSNDDLIAIATEHPRRFRVFAHLPLDDVATAVAELERVMEHDLVVGAAVGTAIGTQDWADESLFPVLECAERTGALLFFHPHTALRRFHLGNLIINPTDTTLAIANLIFSGAFERLPSLKAVFAHGGGYACFASSRFDHAYEVRPELNELIPSPPSTYLSRMYFDNLVHGDAQMRFLVDTFGAGQVVLGTDYPADMGPKDPVHGLWGAPGFTDEEKLAILGGNLASALGIDPATVGASAP